MKIEAGCKAIIINSRAGNDGIGVIVIRYIGTVKGWSHPSHWMIDKTITGDQGSSANHIDESNLMRIDGYKDQDQVSDGKELINVD